MTQIIKIYFKFVSDDSILNNDQTELAKNTWLKYNNIRNKNTHYISYLMKKHFINNSSHEIKYNTYKKPIIDSGFFNISHDGNLCVGIFDQNHNIGIDAIHVHRNISSRLCKKIFNDDEPKDIFQFSRKEAYIKLIGKTIFSITFSDIKIMNGKIYYKGILEPYDIFETVFNEYFICVIGKFNPTEFIFKEFEIPTNNHI